MPDVIIGSRFMEPVPLQGYPVMRREGGKWTKEERFLVNKATLAQYIPEHDSLDTAPNLFGVDLYCNSVEVTQRCEEGFEDICEVRIEWGYEIQSSDYSGAPGISGKKVTYNSQSSFEEKDIKEHPAYKERTDQEKKDLEAYYPRYSNHTVSLSRTERRERGTFALTEHELVGTVGELEAPTGIPGADKKRWRHTGRSINMEKGESIEITDTWTYSFWGWAGCVTPSGSLQNAIDLINENKKSNKK